MLSTNSKDALRRFQELGRAVLDRVDALVIALDPDFKIVFFNAAAEQILGWNSGEIAGRPFLDVLIPAGQREEIRTVLAHLSPMTGPVSHENTWLTRDGRPAWIAWSVSCLKRDDGAIDSFVITGTDISLRKKAEESLRQSEAKYRVIVESTHDGVWVIDAQSKTTFVNARMAEMLGYSVAEMIGTSLFGFMDAEGRAIAAKNVERRRKGIAEQHEFKLLRKDGSPLWTLMDTNPLTGPHGEYAGALALVADITERRKQEDERMRLEAQVLQSQKLESLGVLAGGIAHDFNNLLMTIIGNLELAQNTMPVDAPAKEHIAAATDASLRAADLCKQMLAYSGKGRFLIEPVDINALIAGMANILQVSVSKKVSLRQSLASGLPPIEADATQMRQILMNLVTNASEAIGDASGTVTISTGVKHCDAQALRSAWLHDELAPGTYVSIEVTDTGAGMSQETLCRIFDPFFTTKFTGRGLGLAAVLGIVRGHKGTVHVTSDKDRGSTFTVLLPVQRNAPPAPPKKPHDNKAPLRGHERILVVDDEPSVLLLCKQLLQHLGYDVLTATDGRVAVDVFRQHGDSIDCVILDLMMPDMDGAEAHHALTALRPDVKILLTSGYNEEDIAQRFDGKRLAGIMQKPYQLAALAKKLREILETARPAAGI